MPCEFSLSHYRETIERFLEKGYDFLSLTEYIENYDRGEKIVLLRHDVDCSLDFAEKMVNIEKDLGVKSSVFVRLHSSFYNPLSLKNSEKIKRFDENGFEVGLHFEPIFALNENKNLKGQLEKDVELFEKALGVSVRGINTHLESKSGLRKEDKLEWVELGFSKKGERRIKRYPSDSRCLPIVFPDLFDSSSIFVRDTNKEWGDESFCNCFGKDLVYVLTHPVWWAGDGDKWEIINRLGEGE